MAWHFLPKSFKVYLTVDPDVLADRPQKELIVARLELTELADLAEVGIMVPLGGGKPGSNGGSSGGPYGN